MNADIEKLLNVQEKHIAFLKAKKESALFPKKLKEFDAQIQEIKSRAEDAKNALADMESRRAKMRLDRREIEAKRNKYKIQLLEIKKNDDYIAVNAEIDKLAAAASQIEDIELQLMMDIDAKTLQVAKISADCDAEIADVKKSAANFAATKTSLDAQESAALAIFEDAKKLTSPIYLSAYLNLFEHGKKFPIVVERKDDVCSGCYLKISSDLSSRLDKGFTAPIFCEQCGRIIYV